MNEEHIRRVGRAVGDLRRGFGVVLMHAGEAFWIQAAEAWKLELRDDTPPGSSRLIITGARAKHSGMTGDIPEFLTLQAMPPHELDDYIDAPLDIAAEQIVSEPKQVMQAAIMLTKHAGWRPLVYMSQGMESIPSDATIVDTVIAIAVLNQPVELVEVTSTAVALPLKMAPDSRVRAFRDIATGMTHLAVLVGTMARGEVTQDAPLCRVHSSCITGDILGSLRCDCGDQLHAALHAMSDAGGGVLCYLYQEGRGIGLAYKIHAYQLQDMGADTVDANEILGFEADERDFSVAAAMLEALGITRITLLTHNPRKQHVLRERGIEIVSTQALNVPSTTENSGYLATKKNRMGHLY